MTGGEDIHFEKTVQFFEVSPHDVSLIIPPYSTINTLVFSENRVESAAYGSPSLALTASGLGDLGVE